jgi:hypothetical protein
MSMAFQQDSSIYTCNHSHGIADATLKLPTVRVSTTTYGGTGGFGSLWLSLRADAVKVGFGASAGGRTGTGGFSRISLLQYSTSVSSSAVTGLARLEACN